MILDSVVRMTKDSDRDALTRSMVGTLQEMLDADQIALYWLKPGLEGVETWLLVSASRDGVVKYQKPEALALAGNPDFMRCIDTRLHLSIPAQQTGKIRHIYPILNNDGVLGLLEIIGQKHTHGDTRMISGFLQVFSNYVHIIDESERDTLTGLLNRRTFDKNIGRLLSESREAGDDLDSADDDGSSPRRREGARAVSRWLAVLDIDHFKRVNDKYGHLYGDEVLLLLAGIMHRSFRNNDNLFRFGGEEFVVALEPTDDEGAFAVLERFRQSVESYDFPQVGKVTISIGYVRIGSQDAPSTVVGHADEALYFAKHHGRNQVCSYETLLDEHKVSPSALNVDVELFT